MNQRREIFWDCSVVFLCFDRFLLAKVWARIAYSTHFQKWSPISHFSIQFQNIEKLCLQSHGPPEHQVFNAFICKNVNYLSKGPGRNDFGDNESWTQGAPALLHQSLEMILWGQSVVLRRQNPYFLHGVSTRIFTRIMKLNFKSLAHTHEKERWSIEHLRFGTGKDGAPEMGKCRKMLEASGCPNA